MELSKTFRENITDLNYGSDGGYDLYRLKTIIDTWQKIFGSVYYGEKYHRGDMSGFYNPIGLEWIRYWHYKIGTPKEQIKSAIWAACCDVETAYELYIIAITCFRKFAEERYNRK